MLKVFAFLNKSEDIETQAFVEHYEEAHVPLKCSLAPTRLVYKRNYGVRGEEINPTSAWNSTTAGLMRGNYRCLVTV